MSAKHTPGPWFVDPTGDIGPWQVGTADVPVAEAQAEFCTKGERNANARLMAAAPELLEALKALLPKGWGKDDTMDHMPGVRLARLAIAKAEGK